MNMQEGGKPHFQADFFAVSPDNRIWNEMKQMQNVNLVLSFNQSEEKMLKKQKHIITYITWCAFANDRASIHSHAYFDNMKEILLQKTSSLLLKETPAVKNVWVQILCLPKTSWLVLFFFIWVSLFCSALQLLRPAWTFAMQPKTYDSCHSLTTMNISSFCDLPADWEFSLPFKTLLCV